MKDNALLQTITGAVITTGLTLLGTAVLQKYQNDAAERTRFLDGAQVTAQATTKLLMQDYNALEQLRSSTDKKGFEFYIKDSGQKYEKFYRDWRQQMIQNQFSM
ncbi:hypothetical protein [Pseudomonas sp. Fl4BN1]|uniref:hypothetical protein n=1 Tax=Pseudomonas sp. Fl4BN1 TaxID=2697651 RepID=UPI001377343E|nr:hypothetical protein [Pseudomonas sp. Fl4BN1]NBF08172.1 hypothetical protein [Pseudomonas sp. Fl4BN1]